MDMDKDEKIKADKSLDKRKNSGRERNSYKNKCS